MDIIKFVEEQLGLTLYPYQKAILKLTNKIHLPWYWTYGKQRSGLINPEHLMVRGKRAKIMIYEDL